MFENDFCYENLRNLTIGTVESVSPSDIKVLLEINAPLNTAINNGVPSLFPKINGFVLIPNESGALVGLISWIGIEYSQYPKRKGFKDFEVIDLPYPLRKIHINPLGTLKKKEYSYDLERGVFSFPSVGDVVIVPTPEQLTAIVENKDKNAFVEIGTAPLAANAIINIDPDKLFGRHFAVLGNTGSGKSCSVAGLIRWSLEAAKEKAHKNKKKLNARFIVLDPNGEYSSAFDNIDKPVRKYKVKIGNDIDDLELKVPAWMWNSQEWISFSQAAPGAQRPLLLQALSDLKRGNSISNSFGLRAVTFLNTSRNQLLSFLSNIPSAPAPIIAMCKSLENMREDCQFYASEESEFKTKLENLYVLLNSILKKREWTTGRYNPFSHKDLEDIKSEIENIIDDGIDTEIEASTINADTPIEFPIDNLTPYLEQIAELEGGNIMQFVHMLSIRMRFLISDERIKSVVNPGESLNLVEWLNDYIGENEAENGQISVIDLSLIPSDVMHIIIAVFSRLIFEATQRYKKINKVELPTVLVLEEAHTFIKDYGQENIYFHLCQNTFERIAREGRKFGLSLVLSSQRPSELSPTVLSQCNTFLLHRIVNDKDQDLVRRLVPDNIGGLLKELPVLPTRKAILLGWATAIPILVEMRELEKDYQPHSDDPKFWDVWVGNEGFDRKIDWNVIVDDWQGKNIPIDTNINIEAETISEETSENDELDENEDLPF